MFGWLFRNDENNEIPSRGAHDLISFSKTFNVFTNMLDQNKITISSLAPGQIKLVRDSCVVVIHAVVGVSGQMELIFSNTPNVWCKSPFCVQKLFGNDLKCSKSDLNEKQQCIKIGKFILKCKKIYIGHTAVPALELCAAD